MSDDLEKALSDIRQYNLNDYTVAVFGAGNTSVLYQKCFQAEGICPIYYVDNNKSKHNTVFQGVPVISVEKLVSLKQSFDKPLLVLICSANINVCAQIQSQLKRYGLTYATVDAVVFKNNADKLKEVCDLLEDDLSRDAYIQTVRFRMTNDPVPESLVSSDQYFLLPLFLERSEKEVFVDMGAYVGDTVEQYLNKKSGSFGRIYAFEPDALNFSALTHRTNRLKNEWGLSDDKLVAVRGGIGAKTEIKQFTPPPHAVHTLMSNHTSQGIKHQASFSARLGANFVTDKTEDAEDVAIYAVDDYFREQYVSFIKADIESYESDMLHGAGSVIKRDRPLLAVCIHHNATDMYYIPLFIRTLCGDYAFKIRQHSYRYDESVLYAYIR